MRPSMSRKHFRAIAEVLSSQYGQENGDVNAKQFVTHLATLLSARLQAFNGDFDTDRFVAASTHGYILSGKGKGQ